MRRKSPGEYYQALERILHRLYSGSDDLKERHIAVTLRTLTIADEDLRLHVDNQDIHKRDFLAAQLGQPAMED